MKIEIAESLMLSWLRHAKNCQVVQLNWKPSVSSWELHNEVTVESIKTLTEMYFGDNYGLNLFKKNSSIGQILQQGEIDALGIEIDSRSVRNIYAIDVAFHEGGLNYGSKEETITRVIKKLVRTAMILHAYFNVDNGEIIFASPKVYGIISEPIRKHLQELQYLLQRVGLNFNFSFLCNEDFRDKIYNVVSELSNTVADTSELFMRSIQMNNLFETETVQTANKPRIAHPEKNVTEVTKLDGVKIGVLVKDSMSRLARSNKLNDVELDRLQRLDYCKRTFNVGYPVLKKYDREVLLENQRNIGGYPRYYSDPIRISGSLYLLCNDWYENKNRSYYQKWLANIESE